MVITASLVKELRDKTGAGMMDCKKALVECEGCLEKASIYLREKGILKAAKKASNLTSEGIIDSYIHLGGKIGVLLELNCETDFVAKTDDFKELARDLCLQIAAASPKYVSRDNVQAEEIEQERAILTKQAENEGKSAKMIPNIVEGRLGKFFENICLLEQIFIKDQKRKVEDIIKDKIAKTGENITVKRFTRFQLGEEI